MRTQSLVALAALGAACALIGCSDSSNVGGAPLRVGVAAVPITPCGANPDWDGPTTANGVWGEVYQDLNGNGRYDAGEPFTDDPRNDAIDPQSKGKNDGIYLPGFGTDRTAVGCHDDIWARALVLDDGTHRLAIAVLDLVGMLKYASYYGFARAQRLVDPAAGITDFVFSSTHDHQAPDPLGLWGSDTLVDGKFPLYMQFIDRQVARAIEQAAGGRPPAAAGGAAATRAGREAAPRRVA